MASSCRHDWCMMVPGAFPENVASTRVVQTLQTQHTNLKNMSPLFAFFFDKKIFNLTL